MFHYSHYMLIFGRSHLLPDTVPAEDVIFPVEVIVPLVEILQVDDMSHCDVHTPTPVCAPTENPLLFLINPSVYKSFEQSTPFAFASRYIVLSLALQRTISFLMFSAASEVVNVWVVTVSLAMFPVAAIDAADTVPDVDIDPPVIDPVAVIVELDDTVLPPILPHDAIMFPL